MKYTKRETEEAKTRLLEYLKPDDTVYTILCHVSRSGMMRSISLVIPTTDTQNGKERLGIYGITHLVAQVLDYPRSKNDNGLRVGGCGMDMGYHLVYSLSYVLFGDGYALKHAWL
jgi:hypothetical protein